MSALYIYIGFSYLFMAPYCMLDWNLREKYSGRGVCGVIGAFLLSPISMPIVLGIDSKGGN